MALYRWCATIEFGSLCGSNFKKIKIYFISVFNRATSKWGTSRVALYYNVQVKYLFLVASRHFLPTVTFPRSTWSAMSRPLTWTGRFKNLKRTHECIIHCHHSDRVIEFTTVVGCRKNCDKLAPRKKFITVFHDLMRTYNQIQVMTAEKLTNDVATKCERNAPIIFAPSLTIDKETVIVGIVEIIKKNWKKRKKAGLKKPASQTEWDRQREEGRCLP